MFEGLRLTACRVLIFGFVFVSANYSPGHAQPATSTHRIRVAVQAGVGATELYYAKEQGSFARAGLEIDIEIMSNPEKIVEAVSQNVADIGWADVGTIAGAHAKKSPLVIVAPGAWYTSTAAVTALVVANSSVRTAKDLEGKKVAVTGFGSITDYTTRLWIDRNGGDSSRVMFVEHPFQVMLAELDAHRIDAACITEPFLTIAKKNGRVLGNPYDVIAKEFLITVWFTKSQWAASQPDALKRFATTIQETATWANQSTNLARRAEIIAKYTSTEPTAAVVAAGAARYGERLEPASLQPAIDFFSNQRHFATFPAKEIVWALP